MKDVINHYDLLIDEGNDPVHDPKPLKDYMNKWDGQRFMDCMMLNSDKSVLEIGVGTGRIAMKVAPLCHSFLGIDISPKTIARAEENLSANSNTCSFSSGTTCNGLILFFVLRYISRKLIVHFSVYFPSFSARASKYL